MVHSLPNFINPTANSKLVGKINVSVVYSCENSSHVTISISVRKRFIKQHTLFPHCFLWPGCDLHRDQVLNSWWYFLFRAVNKTHTNNKCSDDVTKDLMMVIEPNHISEDQYRQKTLVCVDNGHLYNDKMWYLAQIPAIPDVCKEILHTGNRGSVSHVGSMFKLQACTTVAQTNCTTLIVSCAFFHLVSFVIVGRSSPLNKLEFKSGFCLLTPVSGSLFQVLVLSKGASMSLFAQHRILN